jgi:hypothetical protein
MSDPLDVAVAAHGGLERWRTVKAVDVELSIGGAIWYVKGRPDVLANIAMRVETGQELVTTTFLDQDCARRSAHSRSPSRPRTAP